MRLRHREDEAADVPLTPLIDVVFLLIVFFLVATSFARREADLAIRLPRVEGEKPNAASHPLVLHVRRDGAVTAEGAVLDEAALRARLAAWRRLSPEGRVAVRGDGEASYRSVAKAMGLCKAAGIAFVDLPVDASAER